jgi:hypothetical protein
MEARRARPEAGRATQEAGRGRAGRCEKEEEAQGHVIGWPKEKREREIRKSITPSDPSCSRTSITTAFLSQPIVNSRLSWLARCLAMLA